MWTLNFVSLHLEADTQNPVRRMVIRPAIADIIGVYFVTGMTKMFKLTVLSLTGHKRVIVLMNAVDLSQFASLFEIGFALHFAVAFIDRIYAKELPVRIQRIVAKAKSLERLKEEISRGLTPTLRFAYRTIEGPVWSKQNDIALDRIYALAQDTKGQTKALQRILKVITFLSIVVVLYSVAMLFLIGLEMDFVEDLNPMTASALVLMQLLPLPIAALIFFVVARRMSNDIDRKIRGIGELQLILNNPDTPANGYASVEQVYRRDCERNGFVEHT